MKPKKHFSRPRQEAEFAFDLTPDLTDGRPTAAHKDRMDQTEGTTLHRNRADDKPHLGRKGGEF